MTHTLWLDLETYSGTDIRYGAHKYAEDPEIEILIFAYAMDDRPVSLWQPAYEAMPAELRENLEDDSVLLVAHNSAFDRTVLRRVLPQFRAFETADRWKDTMIAASALSLPRSLDGLCRALNLPVDKAKDAAGKQLIKVFCQPGRYGRNTAETNPEDWAKFCSYAGRDVEAMRRCAMRMPLHYNSPAVWSQIWREWRIDQRINDRGIFVDFRLASAVQKACAEELKTASAEYPKLTDGQVASPSAVSALKVWLETQGITVTDLSASVVAELLARTDLSDTVRRVLRIRQYAALASVKKFDALINAACSDNRLRGCLVFMGTSRTGRFCGRTFQPQNLPRGSFKPAEVDTAITAFKTGMVDLLYPSALEAGKECLRALLTAPAGCKLCVADLSNIEGRVLAWLAGEEWKLEAFRAFDAGHGVDLYKATYARTFNIRPEDVTKKQRQVGKVMELALGYQGGVGAFVNFARVYGIDLEGDFTASVKKSVGDTDLWATSASSYDYMSEQYADFDTDLSREAWIACRSVRTAWRDAHPAIQSFWEALKDAAIRLTGDRPPEHPFRVGKVTFSSYANGNRRDILITLPSGRVMVYPLARKPEKGERAEMVFREYSGYGTSGTDICTYAGKLCENITQAVARDILTSSMEPIENAGYRIVLSVHDEYIAEAPDTPDYTHEELARLMATPPAWADGLPLAAAGFEAMRYRKD